MESIIAATDFSEVSRNAVNYAADMAKQTGAELTILHVIEVPLALRAAPLTITEFEEIEKCVQAELDDMEQDLLTRAGHSVKIYKEIKYGFTETAIEKICNDKNPLALIIGLKSAPAVDRFLFGSTALRLVPYIKFPLLMIPKNAVFKGIHSITIASDLEQIQGNATLGFIKKWLEVFHVNPDILHAETDDEIKHEKVPVNVFLYNRFSNFDPQFHLVKNKDIEDAILDFTAQKKPDILIVVPGKYSFLKKIFHASHSKYLILHSHLPVLVMSSHRLHATKNETEVIHTNKQKKCSSCDGLCCNEKKLHLKNHADNVDQSHIPS